MAEVLHLRAARDAAAAAAGAEPEPGDAFTHAASAASDDFHARAPDVVANALGMKRMELLYGSSAINVGVNAVAAVTLGVWLALEPPASSPWIWVAVVLGVCAARAALTYAFNHAGESRGSWRRWHAWFVAGAAASGISWGLAAVLLPLESLAHFVLAMFVMGGMLAGAMVATVPSVPAYFAFSATLLVGLVFLLVARSDQYGLPAALLCVFFVAVISVYVRRLNRSLMHSIGLQFEHNRLLERMGRINESLEARVAARTGELRRVNRDLELDIEARRRAELALRESEQRYRALYDDNPSMFITLDRGGAILSINRFGARSLGFRVEDLRDTLWFELVEETYRGHARARLAASFERPSSVHHVELKVQLADGGSRWLRVAIRALESAQGAMRALLVCQDISEARSLSEKLSYHASHDPLTGLVNRREFETRLRRTLERTDPGPATGALCYLDLDQFKIINDTCGHAAGDELLRRIAATLRDSLRKRDTLARLGGDEFGVLIEHCDPAQAHRVANALRQAVSDFRFPWNGKSFSLGVSIGLVPLDGEMRSLSQALRAADSACYVAKDLGRNRIHVYSKGDTELDRRHGEIQWVERLQSALAEDRFTLAYQLIVPAEEAMRSGLGTRTDDDTIEPGLGVSKGIVELLLRMRDTQGAVVHPRAFLAAAERYSLATPIDEWVVGNAFRWFAANGQALDKLDLCFVNLSGRSLGEPGFLSFIREGLRDAGLPPGKFCFEVTETAAISNLMDARRFMQALQGIGCKFALDDFGSGLSSFAYLKDLPVDFIKIDGVFSKDVERNPVQRALIKSISDVGHVMGKRTIAEWVETGPAIETLREIGVDYIQGYASGGPQPLDSL